MTGFSVVICTYNGGNRLIKVLDCIRKQEGRQHYEVLLIDNASDDDTKAVIETYTAGHPGFPLIYMHEPRKGKAYALETGLDRAVFSHAIICDDDNWLLPGYFEAASKAIKDSADAVYICGQNQAFFEEKIPGWLEKFRTVFAIGKQGGASGYLPENKPEAWSAGAIVQLNFWRKLRSYGFRFFCSKHWKKALGEDSEFCLILRLCKKQMYYDEALKLVHYQPKGRLTWQRCLNIAKDSGRSNIYLTIIHESYLRKSAPEIRKYINRKFFFTPIKYICSKPGELASYFLNGEGNRNGVLMARRFGNLMEYTVRRNYINECILFYDLFYRETDWLRKIR